MKNVKFLLLGFVILSAITLSLVSCEEEILKPTAAITVQVNDYQVSFTSIVTDANTYAWDFGDGETGTEANPIHTYAVSGVFTANLTVTGKGGTAVATTIVTITVDPTVAIEAIVEGFLVSFTSIVNDANTYSWDFGDGETGTDANPVHTYAALGTYTVTLTVTGSGGTAVTTTSITIADKPTVEISANVEGYLVSFTSIVTDVNTYAWDFGDNEVSTESNPVHTFAMSGSYTATLTVTGNGGTASATTSFTIEASKFEMLTGGPAMADGKIWVISPIASEGDGIYKANAEFQFEDVIPNWIFGLIGLASEYEDEFTFKYDLSYSHVTKNDSVMADIVYCIQNQINYRTSAEDFIVLAPFTPASAIFNFMEDTSLTLEVVDQDDDNTSLNVTWSDVDILEIEGGNEFVGILDYTRKYIILDISEEKLQIGIFVATSGGTKASLPKHMIVITLIPAV